MNKAVPRSASLILAIVLSIGNFTSGRAIQNKTLMPDRTVNLAFFYKPPQNSDAVTVAGFGSVILTAGDEAFRDQVRANGLNSTITQYLRAEAIMDPGNCTTAPYKNQVAYKAGDFCYISQNYPSWFLLDAYGRRIQVAGSNYYRMDPGNAGWRSFFLARLLEMQQERGWSGLFLDNVEAGLNQIQRDGATSPLYPDNASYRAAVRGFLQYLYQNYAQAYGRPIMTNIIARSNTDDAVWFDYMQYMNGAMQERWSVDWDHSTYLSESNWLADMTLAERTQSQGKFIILVAPGQNADTNRQTFAYASYLLISNGKAAFRYSNSSSYREVWMYNNYSLQLGTPLGARYQLGSSWRRDFTNGYVIVDPVNRTASISATPPATPTLTTTPTALPTQTSTQMPTQIPTLPPLPTMTSTTAAVTIFDEKNSAFSYSNGWTEVADNQAYNGTFKRTQAIGSSVTFSFTGQRFTLIYKTGPQFGKMTVYLDGVLLLTLDQNTTYHLYQRKWVYGGMLSQGAHQIKLVYSRGPVNGRVSIDAISVP